MRIANLILILVLALSLQAQSSAFENNSKTEVSKVLLIEAVSNKVFMKSLYYSSNPNQALKANNIKIFLNKELAEIMGAEKLAPYQPTLLYPNRDFILISEQFKLEDNWAFIQEYKKFLQLR